MVGVGVSKISKKKKKKKKKGLFFCIRSRILCDFLIHRHFPGDGEEGQQDASGNRIEEEGGSQSCLEDCFLFSNKRQFILCIS